MKNYPSLKICGNPQSSAGYTDIYIINEASFDIPNLGHEGMGLEDYYFVVTITQYNVQYVLVQNRVRSFGANRQGCLKMGISIPKHYRLVGNKSPYDVLMEVYQTMKSVNLSLIAGTTNEYQYNERMCDDSIFEAILSRYPFEACVSVYRPMMGTTPVLVKTDKIREFMMDPHFEDVVRYKEVLLARNGDYPYTLTLPEIPRRPQFKLVVNNNPTSWPKDPLSGNIKITLSGLNAKCYEIPEINFDLSNYLKTQNAPAGVKVDMEREIVYCTLIATPRIKAIKFKIDGVDKVKENSILSMLQVVVGLNVKTLLNGTLALKGEEVIKPIERITYSGQDYSVKGFAYEGEDVIKVAMAPIKRTVNTNNGGGFTTRTTPRVETNTTQQPVRKPIKVAVLLSKDDLKESDPFATIKISSYGKGSLCAYYKDAEFKPITKDGELVGWLRIVDIPAEIVTTEQRYLVTLRTKRAKYREQPVPLTKIPELEKAIREKDILFLDLRAYDPIKKSPFELYHKPITLALIIAFFILGLAGGWFAKKLYPGNQSQNPEGKEVVVNPEDPGENVNRRDEKLEEIKALYARLNADDVTFEEITDLVNYYKAYSRTENANKEEFKAIDPDKIDKYHDIVYQWNNFRSANRGTIDDSSFIKAYNGFYDVVEAADGYLTENQKSWCKNLYNYKDKNVKAAAILIIFERSRDDYEPCIEKFQDFSSWEGEAKARATAGANTNSRANGGDSSGGSSQKGKKKKKHVERD